MLFSVLAVASGLMSLAITWYVAKKAGSLGLVQSPNARSSHTMPTPSGGGLAIALATLTGGLCLALTGAPQLLIPLSLLAAIAALGLWDDFRDLSPLVRLLVQAAVVIGLVWGGGGLPAITMGEQVIVGGLALSALAVIAGIWWINLFNFMDGIDGLAASQALLHLVGLILLWFVQGADEQFGDRHMNFALLTIAALIGFLWFNWPPARIFMGDVGSNFLAAVTLSVALAMLARGIVGFGSVIALTSVFLSDATTTLIMRIGNGKRPWHAHRSHAYQRLAMNFGHFKVTIGYAMLTLLWAFPAAIATILWPTMAWPIAAMSVLPLSVLAIITGAGRDFAHA